MLVTEAVFNSTVIPKVALQCVFRVYKCMVRYERQCVCLCMCEGVCLCVCVCVHSRHLVHAK